MRIDAHQHYWRLDRGDYGWITPGMGVLNRDYLPDDLVPHLRKHRLDGTILVQAAATVGETEFMLSLAEENESILGVVGWLDLFDQNHRDHFENFRRHPKFVGFRIIIQGMPDSERILEPAFVEALRGYADEDVPVDVLVVSNQLEPTVRLLQLVPGVHAVIDHIAKPRIRDGIIEPWLSQMKQIAAMPNIYCKVSGMVTEADHKHWKSEDFTVYIRHILELYGPNRVLFGSDWPVCLLAADYNQVVDVLTQALPDHWGNAEREKLFGGNARTFYRIGN